MPLYFFGGILPETDQSIKSNEAPFAANKEKKKKQL